ncbi:MAG: hypothetical protein GY827_00195 [Cytophagales bacterium]|nr:hypothetical protein [Cytophagales bacterium]
MKKVEAFSLAEIIVALILSAIVTTFAYQGYRVFYGYYFDYQSQNQKIEDLNRLHSQIQKWTLSSKKIILTGQTLNFEMLNHHQVLTFESDYVVSTIHNQTDTIFGQVVDLHFLWEKENQREGVIDAFSFSLIMNEKTYPYSFVKQYGAQYYLYKNRK